MTEHSFCPLSPSSATPRTPGHPLAGLPYHLRSQSSVPEAPCPKRWDRQAPNCFPNEPISHPSVGEGHHLFGGTLKHRTARTDHPQLALTLLPPQVLRPRTLLRGASVARTFGGPSRPHWPSALPSRCAVGAQGTSLRRPRPPHPAPQPGLGSGGRVLRTGALFPTTGGGSRRGAGPPLRPRRARGRRVPAHIQAEQSAAPRTRLRPRRAGPRALALLPRPRLTTGPLRLRGQRAFPQLQTGTSPRANFPTRAGPHNFGARGSGGGEGRGPAPGGHQPAPCRVRARAPGVGGCLPKVHSGEAGRVA